MSSPYQITQGFIQAKHMAGFEPHNWMFDYQERYRDRDGKEFILEFYKCDCGAGGKIKTPIELYHTDMHPKGAIET